MSDVLVLSVTSSVELTGVCCRRTVSEQRTSTLHPFLTYDEDDLSVVLWGVCVVWAGV